MTPSREIELKFLCEPRDLDKVLAAAPPGEDETRELDSVYFDTLAGDLARKGVSLRVRRSGGRQVQTLKRGQGLSREEHEAPVDGAQPDRTRGPLRKLLPKGAGTLAPVFKVHVVRRQRLLRHGDATVELALDEGEVRAGRRRAAVSEVELELKSGEPAALFALARELALAAPLYLSFESKAARGQALRAGAGKAARRKGPLKLPRRATAADAFQAVARQALRQIAVNAALMRDVPEAEALHQLRVGARRLRSAFATFAPLFADSDARDLKAELKWLAKACDPARNLDVFGEETVAPARAATPGAKGLAQLARAVETARAKAGARAGQAVSSERFRRLLIEAAAWIETGDWLDARRKIRQAPAADFAADRLAKRRRKLLKAGKHLARLDDAQRHHVRIEAKKLRYASDALAGLFPHKAARRFLDRLKRLQDALGQLNDMATAEPLIADLNLGPAAAQAADELIGGTLAKKPRGVARAARALSALSVQTPFWT